MSENTDIREALRTLIGHEDLAAFKSLICTVSNINTTTMTCDCIPINGEPDFVDVLLCVDGKKGFVLIPTDGSFVAVTQTSETDAYLAMVSEVDGIWLNGNTNGGLVKVVDLTTKLNNLENKVNQLITAFNAWTPVPNDGGAALKTALTTWVATSLTPTVRANIENTNVKHG
jgi:hypothetical protein